MTEGQSAPAVFQERIREVFGDYRAEWLNEKVFDLFTEPLYFPSLTSRRPAVLIGGRGTGKTTVLRGLSYEGRYEITGKSPADRSEWQYFGLYYKVLEGRVKAFKGPGLTEERWGQVFEHFVNLVFLELLLDFFAWYRIHGSQDFHLPAEIWRQVAISLNSEHIVDSPTEESVKTFVIESRVSLQAFVNNAVDSNVPMLSSLGAPWEIVLDSLFKYEEFRDTRLFFLIDEFETLSDQQQRVFNTLLKQSGPLYSMKIGVKELGWKIQETTERQWIESPADYARFDITAELTKVRFEEFAENVCMHRLRYAAQVDDSSEVSDGVSSVNVPPIGDWLPELSEVKEFELLGGATLCLELRSDLRSALNSRDAGKVDEISDLELYLLQFWAEGHGTSLVDQFMDWLSDRDTWRVRLGNYQHAMLFTVRKGKRGIRKHYAGWDVYLQLASGNIRFVLQLIEAVVLAQLRGGEGPFASISHAVQTEAAVEVAKAHLRQLQRSDASGGALARFVLGYGRVLGILAAQAEGHAPEVNQFYVSGNGPRTLRHSAEGDEARPETPEEILRSGVMHLALLRQDQNKLGSTDDASDWLYMLHPIFAPMFSYSYRRKRKMALSLEEIAGLTFAPATTIPAVVGSTGRRIEGEVPSQLALFGGFYGQAQ